MMLKLADKRGPMNGATTALVSAFISGKPESVTVKGADEVIYVRENF